MPAAFAMTQYVRAVLVEMPFVMVSVPPDVLAWVHGHIETVAPCCRCRTVTATCSAVVRDERRTRRAVDILGDRICKGSAEAARAGPSGGYRCGFSDGRA